MQAEEAGAPHVLSPAHLYPRRPVVVMDEEKGPRRPRLYSLESFGSLYFCLQISGLWQAPGAPWVIRKVYRWAAPVVLALYIFFDEVSNYHGPEDDNAPTAPNHYAILCRLVLFLASHLLGSQYLYSGHLDMVIRSAALTDAEFAAIDRKVTRFLMGGISVIWVLLGYSMVFDFMFHQNWASSQIAAAWMLVSIRVLYGYFSLVFMQGVHWLLICMLNREVDLVTHHLVYAGTGLGAAGSLTGAGDHKTDAWVQEPPSEPVRSLREAIHLHKSLRTLLKAHSTPLQWWLASYLALVAGWTFTLYFVNHELQMAPLRKLLTYSPLWCMNMYFFIVPVLLASSVHANCGALVDLVNDLTPSEGLFADRQVLEMFVSYARRTQWGFYVFGTVITRNPTYVAVIFGVCEGMFM